MDDSKLRNVPFSIISKMVLMAISVLFFSCLSDLSEPFYEEQNKADHSKIYYKDASEKLMIAVSSLANRCESFRTSGYNYVLSYTFMTTGNFCNTLNSDIIKGCADFHYLQINEVDLCLTQIINDPCNESGSPPQETSEASGYRFFTFAFCSSAFKSNMPMPMFF